MSEFDIISVLLRQQKEFIGERLDGLEVRAASNFEEIKTRLQAVEHQVRLTNGTVRKHTEQLTKLESPDVAALLTKGEGKIIRRALVAISGLVTTVVLLLQWLWSVAGPKLVVFFK